MKLGAFRGGLFVGAALVLPLLAGCTPAAETADRTFSPAPTATFATTAAEIPHQASEIQTYEPVEERAATSEASKEDILADLVFEEMAKRYSSAGLTLTAADWDELSTTVCNDLRVGGPGWFTSGDTSMVSDPVLDSLAEAAWAAMFGCIPQDHVLSDEQISVIGDFLAPLVPEYEAQVAAAGLEIADAPLSEPSLPAYSYDYGGSGVDTGYDYGSDSGSSYNYRSDTSYDYDYEPGSGSGYTVRCNDGSYSGSGGKQGACSWHGGIDR